MLYLPDATIRRLMPNAHGAQTGLKFLLKTYFSPQFSRKWRLSLFFKILSDVALTIFSGKEFQFSHTLFEKKTNFPMSK